MASASTRWSQLENQAVLVTANLVERYDFATNSSEAVAPLAEARYDLAVGVLDGKLYAAGGWDANGILSSVERYDPASNTWEAVAAMGTARAGFGAAVLDGRLYAAGALRTDSG